VETRRHAFRTPLRTQQISRKVSQSHRNLALTEGTEEV
jgi:hypothetical protein